MSTFALDKNYDQVDFEKILWYRVRARDEAKTEGWIKTSVELLKSRTFPRTPDVDDCRFCPFKPVCGSAANGAAAAVNGAQCRSLQTCVWQAAGRS